MGRTVPFLTNLVIHPHCFFRFCASSTSALRRFLVGMDWLSKAGDLLDKVDQLAAERLLADDGVDEDQVLALLDEAEKDATLGAVGAPDASAADASAGRSPRAELQVEVERLKRSLQTKTAHVEQLVASQRALLKSKSAREGDLNDQTARLREQIDQVGVQRKLLEQGRKHAEQQAEAAKMSLKNHSEELAAARKQLQSVQEERDAAHGRIAELQATQQEHEQVMNSLQERHSLAMQQLEHNMTAHKSEVHDLQDREESLSSATVQFTSELARAERRRLDSDAAARQAEALHHEAEEHARRLEGTLEEERQASAKHAREVARLQLAVDAREAVVETARAELEAATHDSRKRIEELELLLRQREREISEVRRAAARAAAQDNEVMCERVCLCVCIWHASINSCTHVWVSKWMGMSKSGCINAWMDEHAYTHKHTHKHTCTRVY